MPLTLVVETGAGLTTANSYVTVADATAYFTRRLYSGIWSAASAGDQAAALVWATSLLDQQLRWQGDRISTTQALEWPRSYVLTPDRDAYYDSASIPAWLEDATAELAQALLEKDRPKEAEQQRVVSRSAGGKSVGLSARDRQFQAIIPPPVMSIIPATAVVKGAVRLVRC
jgi:hypothetical protein